MLDDEIDHKFRQLAHLNAGDFDHIDGSLIQHLIGTHDLLKQWNASLPLQDAGLYHAAYGTAGFEANLVGTDQRDKIANIIGDEAEQIVYFYCACDRDYVWQQFPNAGDLIFRDRFTGNSYKPTDPQLRVFCELTAANELQIANQSSAFANEHGAGLYKLLKSMQYYLSDDALSSLETTLGSYKS